MRNADEEMDAGWGASRHSDWRGQSGVDKSKIRKKKLGADHPDTLTSMHNLAFTWKGQGREEEALRLMDECTSLRTRVLSAKHPDTLSSTETLIKWKVEKSGMDEGIVAVN